MAYVENNVPYGAQLVTIGSVGFVCEQVNMQEPSTVIEQRGPTGDPTGQVLIAGFLNGTALMQLASSATAIPTVGATFTIARNGTSVTMGVVISEVGEVQQQLEARKVNVNIRKRVA